MAGQEGLCLPGIKFVAGERGKGKRGRGMGRYTKVSFFSNNGIWSLQSETGKIMKMLTVNVTFIFMVDLSDCYIKL